MSAADAAKTPERVIQKTHHTKQLHSSPEAMEINYLGSLIGVPVLVGFAVLVAGIHYYFVKQEERLIRTRNEIEMNRVHEDELDPPRRPDTMGPL